MEIVTGTPSGAVGDPGTCDLGELTLSVACPTPGVFVVGVVGELDMLTAPLLDRCVQEQLAVQPAHLVVDLEAVKFLGSTGLTTLIMARDRARAVGSVLHLTGMTKRAVARPLEVTGLLPLFNLYPTLADALGKLTYEHGEPDSME